MERGRPASPSVLALALTLLAPLPAQFAATAAEAAQGSVRDAQSRIGQVKAQQDANIDQRQQLQREIQELQRQIQAVRMEKAKVLNELKQGLYCSQCNRSKTQLAADGIDFQRHLAEVNGRPVAAPPEVVAEVAKQFDQQIEALQLQIRNLQQRGKDLEFAYNQLSIDLSRANAELSRAQQAVATARFQAQMKQSQERSAESLRQLQQTLNGIGDLLVGGSQPPDSAPRPSAPEPRSGWSSGYAEEIPLPSSAYQPPAAPLASPPRGYPRPSSPAGSDSVPSGGTTPADAPVVPSDGDPSTAAQELDRASSEALRRALIESYLRQREPAPAAPVGAVDPTLLVPPASVPVPVATRMQRMRDQFAAIAGDGRRSMAERLGATVYGTIAQALTGEVTAQQYAVELEKNGKRIAGLGSMLGISPWPTAQLYAKALEGTGASFDLLAHLMKAKSPTDALTLQGASKLSSVVALGANTMAWRSFLDGIKVAAQLDAGDNQDWMGATLTVLDGVVASRADQRLSNMLNEWKQRATREGWLHKVRDRVYAGAFQSGEYQQFLLQLPSRTKTAGEALADELQRATGGTPLQPREYSDLLQPIAPGSPKPSVAEPRK